ncbi:hypothetical protein LWC33_18380 [Pseudonocardia sp. RS11V-5]|nr:hypothetical protein [Pseudonocardia terrae]
MTPEWAALLGMPAVLGAVGAAVGVIGALGGVLVAGLLNDRQARRSWQRELLKRTDDRRLDLYLRLWTVHDEDDLDVAKESLAELKAEVEMLAPEEVRAAHEALLGRVERVAAMDPTARMVRTGRPGDVMRAIEYGRSDLRAAIRADLGL